MPASINASSSVWSCRTITSAPWLAKAHGTHGVSPGLYLQVKPNGARSWLFRYAKAGKTHWLGLGAAGDVGLKEAREKAEDLRSDIRRKGTDPMVEKRAAKPSAVPTFDWCAEQFIAAHESSWRNEKHRAQWTSTIRTHASPVLGALPVDRIDVHDVERVLKPIWLKLPETASKLRGRLEMVLGWAAAKGFRGGENPARWKGGALIHLLPRQTQKVEPRKSVPYAEVPALTIRLSQHHESWTRLRYQDRLW